MGVVVRRYIDILTIIINFPYSTCISSFLAAVSLLLCSFLNVFRSLYICSCYIQFYFYICYISNRVDYEVIIKPY